MSVRRLPVVLFTAALAFHCPAGGLPTQVPEVRKDHPRLFFNAETWPKIKAASEAHARDAIDRLVARCRRYPENPVCGGTEPAPPGHSGSTPLKDITEWGRQASECALAWRFTGERAFVEKAKRMLTVSIAAYHEAYRNRRAVNWMSQTRILALCAYDWLYETLTDEERRAIIVPLMRHVDEVQPGPGKPAIVRRNGGPTGYTTGHYGVDALLWYGGVAAVGDGFCDEVAKRCLETGYGYECKLLAYREEGAGDDGPLTTGTCGYAMGCYPWAHFNFFHTLASATGVDAAPLYPGLALFPNFIWWNWIRTDGVPLLFGFGDTRHQHNALEIGMLNEHMTQYAHFYAKSDPDSARLAMTLREMSPKTDMGASWPVYPFLFAEPIPVEPFSERELTRFPLRARYFEPTGQIFLRSGWTPGATYCLFSTGGPLTGGHRHFDDNNFVIYKRGFLALDTGSRAYQDDYNLAHYYAQTVAHNCVLIHKPDEPLPPHWGVKYDGPEGKLCDGGQTVYGAAKMLAFETNPLFTYIASDAAASYRGKSRECVRQFLYVTDDCFVVYDRVSADRADWAKEWLLHTEEEPTVEGGLMSAKAQDGAIFCRTLLPEGAALEKIGGPGKEFWSNGRNWELNPQFVRDSEKLCRNSGGPWFGKWRLSVRPPAPAKDDRFLHVINVGAADGAQADASRLVKDGVRDGAVVEIPNFTVRGQTGTLEVTALFNRTGKVGGEIRYRLLDARGAELFGSKRVFTESVAPQAGVFSRRAN